MNDLERDLIRNDALDAFEASVFRRTVATARRVRRTRTITPVALVTALCLAAFQIPFGERVNDSRIALQENALSTAPARQLQVFRSKPFAGTVQTTPLTPERTLATKAGLVAVVRTSNLEQPEIVRINDNELLSLFQGKPVAIVGKGANAELIFPDSSDRN